MTTATTTLTDFLLARIAEDEAAARAAVERNGACWGIYEVQDGATVTGDVRRNSNPRSYGEDDALWDDEGALGMWNETASHVARHDPARVLAECGAKQRIVGEYVDREAIALCPTGPCELAEHAAAIRAFELAVKILALPYADHPDYRPEWRP